MGGAGEPLRRQFRRGNSMAQPRPSCTLILDIDETLATEETKLEVGRCYTYVGSALVRPHAATEPAHCYMRLLPKLGCRKYLHAADEGADELWKSVMEQWFYNQFHTISNNMRIYNRRQREEGNPELVFERLDVELENGALTVRLALDSTCRIPPERADVLTAVRAAFNEGKLGEDVVAVNAPGAASLAAQAEAGHAAAMAKAEAEAAEAAQKAAEAEAAAAAAEADAANEFLESPSVADADRIAAAKAEEELHAKLEEQYGEEEPEFVVDFTMWDVEYADGSVRTYDSAAGSFVEEA